MLNPDRSDTNTERNQQSLCYIICCKKRDSKNMDKLSILTESDFLNNLKSFIFHQMLIYFLKMIKEMTEIPIRSKVAYIQ